MFDFRRMVGSSVVPSLFSHRNKSTVPLRPIGNQKPAFPTVLAIGATAQVDNLAFQFLVWGSIAVYFHSFQRFSIPYVTGITF
jgi:hypothetical protein